MAKKPKEKNVIAHIEAQAERQALDRAVKTFSLALTKYELVHLRDVLSVTLPSTNTTVSQALATLEKRALIEGCLWQKVQAVCKAASIPLSNKAPDYVIAAVGQPSMCVFRLATDPSEAETKEILLNEKTEEAILMSPASRKV
jgi:hypothetical protein